MMTAYKILRHHIRYSRCFLALAPPLPQSLPSFVPTIPHYGRNLTAHPLYPSCSSPLPSNYIAGRAFSWTTSLDSEQNGKPEEDAGGSFEGRVDLNHIDVLQISPDSWYHYPIKSVIAMLDGFHYFSGLPWWVVISFSTLFLRAALFPVLVLQLRKMAKLGELLPRLPPPFPPLGSRRSFREQYQLFREKRRELNCPSYLWNFAFFTVQFPCFLLWMSSIRRMCLNHHPGFDSGGALWFQNLTDYPHGISSFIFPTLIAGLHYINVQISFQTIKFANLQGVLGLLAKFYKLYLDILAIPLFLVGFYIPQGSLVYWLTNSSLTLIQQLCLKNPAVRDQLGLPNLAAVPLKKQVFTTENEHKNADASEIIIPLEAVASKKLLELALKDMASGDQDRALVLLRKATEKDPNLAKALVAIGQILCSKKLFEEAAENFELAITKFSHVKGEETGLLIISLFGAGVSRIWQGNTSDGIEHLKKIAELEEPDNSIDKASYYRGLVMLGSTLFQLGKKSEAAKYLKKAASYDPGVNSYLKECEVE